MKPCPVCGTKLADILVDAINNPYRNENCPKAKKSKKQTGLDRSPLFVSHPLSAKTTLTIRNLLDEANHNHMPVQHHDGKRPWCKECGLTASLQTPRSEFGRPEYHKGVKE